ncbi:histidinol dehydrogenase [Glutamicibacter protophormiae]|uniref:histidinol dehydrogenase n=1 Tax=unclassified Kocuria TaxID=2649579 RepID=UPI000F87DEFE|nr:MULTISPECIES: histidinol dehydrogenase [unclassified Kocuria]MDN5631225.1 histidinol dehydrogenase [Kocuria sp.]RUP84774.1 histidinol dehydrogenase [Kocuria sp. HSID17590]RUQ10303.1 histidinol dehydrogenase [Kocuria sp. HSID17582]WNB89901.1 histidinol dehydrogenase [Glutamicibacter protophormiae]
MTEQPLIPASTATPGSYLRVTDLRGTHLGWSELRAAVPRQAPSSVVDAEDAVRGIIEDVKARGARALRELARKFDGVEQERIRVAPEEIERAVAALDPAVRHGLESAIERTRAFAAAQRPSDVTIEVAPGATLHHRWTPVRRAGLYIPGGLAVYPSSVVMNVVPAQAAGVETVVLCSPPQKEFGGLPHPVVLGAAGLLGVDEVWAVGGAQALAAMAHGVVDGEDVLEPVNTVTGPGNIFVAMAKRQLRSVVGVDAEAGTTEIAVLADDSADPRYVAADLISQAEHDPAAGSVLITDSPELARAVEEQLTVQVPEAKHRERIMTALSGPQSGVVLTDDLDVSVAVADAYAAEHLEIHTRGASEVAARIRNAGAVFVGPYSPVPLGDYAAGSNHVLPTGGTAVFSSGLQAASFMKAVQVIEYSREALAALEEDIVALSASEDLPAHGRAVTLRGEDRGTGADTDTVSGG